MWITRLKISNQNTLGLFKQEIMMWWDEKSMVGECTPNIDLHQKKKIFHVWNTYNQKLHKNIGIPKLSLLFYNVQMTKLIVLKINSTYEILTTKYYVHHQFHPLHDVAEHIHSQVYGYLPMKQSETVNLLMLKNRIPFLLFNQKTTPVIIIIQTNLSCTKNENDYMNHLDSSILSQKGVWTMVSQWQRYEATLGVDVIIIVSL